MTTSFDLDIISHINSEFSVLHDLGVGPQAGFVIEDEAVEWSAYLPSEELVKLVKVKTCCVVRLVSFRSTYLGLSSGCPQGATSGAGVAT